MKKVTENALSLRRAVIGGGMSGLVCAVASAKCGAGVTLFEKNARVGKKISVTGNGKCNLCNVNVSADDFNESRLVRTVLSRYSPQDCLAFFRSIGIFTYTDEKGRVYPVTDNANSVVDCLRAAATRFGVKTVTDCVVCSVRKEGDGYLVGTAKGDFRFDSVVVCCGGKSQADLPLTDALFSQKYGTALVPSLTPLKIRDMPKILNGLRLKTKVTLMKEGHTLPVATEEGEVQFRDFGLSGICVMDLSARIARAVVAGERADGYVVETDLAPHLSAEDLLRELSGRRARNVPEEQLFYGILHNKMAEYVVKSVRQGQGATDDATFVTKLVSAVKKATFRVEKLADFSQSQVTAGGVDEKYLDDCFALPNGVHVVGEAVNADGICGGCNLYFATASALCVLPREYKEKVLL